MPIGKEIKVSVDDSPLSQVRQNAQKIAMDMIRSSRELHTSSREITRDIKEQITLLEKRNRLQEELQKQQVAKGVATGALTSEQASQRLQSIQSGSQEGRLLINLVREVIETIKQTSKEEIREDRNNVVEKLRQSKTLGVQQAQGDPQSLYTEAIQEDILRTRNIPQRRGGFQDRMARRQFGDLLHGATSVRNEYELMGFGLGYGTGTLGGMALGMPPQVAHEIGKVLGDKATEIVRSGEGAQRSIADYSALNRRASRGRISSIAMEEGAPAYLGMNIEEEFARRADIQRLTKRRVDLAEFSHLMGAERTLGFGAETTAMIGGATRYDKNTSIVQVISTIDKHLLEMGKDVSQLPEMAETFSKASERILSYRGSLDADHLAKVITGISKASGFEGRELDRLVGGFQGLGSRGGMTEAFMFDAFRKEYGNLSPLRLKSKMMTPLAKGSLGGTRRMLEDMMVRSGGNEDMMIGALAEMMGGDENLPMLFKLFDKTGGDISSVLQEAQRAAQTNKSQVGTGKAVDYVTDLPKYVSSLEESTKKWESLSQLAGSGIVDGLDGLKGVIQELLDGMKLQKMEGSEDMKDSVKQGAKEGIKEAFRESGY